MTDLFTTTLTVTLVVAVIYCVAFIIDRIRNVRPEDFDFYDDPSR